MMATKERAAVARETRRRPQRPNKHRQESITNEALTCGLCGVEKDLHILASGFLCVSCIGAAVSMAANDLWPGSVRYDLTFETAVLM